VLRTQTLLDNIHSVPGSPWRGSVCATHFRPTDDRQKLPITKLGGSAVIEPAADLPLLTTRPSPIPPPWWIGFCCAVAGPLVDRWLKAREVRLQSRASELLVESRRCATRTELESILGPPEYRLEGHLFALGNEIPDFVESYARDGCRIELWFRQNGYWLSTGNVDLSPWHVARLTSSRCS